MKKRTILTALWAGLVCVSLCSCHGTENPDEKENFLNQAELEETDETPRDGEDLQTPKPDDAGQSEEDLQSPEVSEKDRSEDDQQGQDTPEGQGASASEAAFSYQQLATLSFHFLSGAGGWSTDMTVSADGSFDGLYLDSDMGDMGEGYPNGTVYFCKFAGRFGELKKVDDFTYQTTIVEMQYENEPDTEEIVDGTLYRYTDVYGLEDAENILFYLPGTPVESLSEESRSWLRDALYDWETNEWLEELPCVVLCNEAMEECFYSSDNVDSYLGILPYLQESVTESLAGLEQGDGGEDRAYTAQETYRRCDDSLNELWGLLKLVLPAEEMEQLTAEQRLWIADKEQQMEEASAGVSDSTEAEVQSNMAGARLTLDRIGELASKLEAAETSVQVR